LDRPAEYSKTGNCVKYEHDEVLLVE